MGRGVDFQEIPLIAALIEADAPLGVADQLKFGLLQLAVQLPVLLLLFSSFLSAF
jgi:hypothetical protein